MRQTAFCKGAEGRDMAIDNTNSMSDAAYEQERARLRPDELRVIQQAWIDDPSKVENYNRLAFVNAPNAKSLEELERSGRSSLRQQAQGLEQDAPLRHVVESDALGGAALALRSRRPPAGTLERLGFAPLVLVVYAVVRLG